MAQDMIGTQDRTMNLYLLEREAPAGQVKAFVVAAKGLSAARRAASRQADGEPGPWLDEKVSACSCIGVTTGPARQGVVLRERAEARR